MAKALGLAVFVFIAFLIHGLTFVDTGERLVEVIKKVVAHFQGGDPGIED